MLKSCCTFHWLQMKRFHKRRNKKKYKFNKMLLDSRVDQMGVFTDYIAGKRDKETPFPLHVLSHGQFLKVKDNVLLVGGYKRTGKGRQCRTEYTETLHVGVNLKHIMGVQSRNHPIDIRKFANQSLIILCPLHEIMEEKGLVLVGDPIKPTVFDGRLQERNYCVLCVVSSDESSIGNDPDWWSPDDILHARREKPNVVPKSGHAHFGSEGKIYGYGLVAKFDKLTAENRASFAEYATRK